MIKLNWKELIFNAFVVLALLALLVLALNQYNSLSSIESSLRGFELVE